MVLGGGVRRIFLGVLRRVGAAIYARFSSHK